MSWRLLNRNAPPCREATRNDDGPVDDNAQNRALAQATLADEGYDVLLAETALLRVAAEAQGGTISIEDGNPGAVCCMSLPNAK